jgi:4-hydroxybenzoate polyprenyltransferase
MKRYWKDLTTTVDQGIRARSAVRRLTRAEEHIPFVVPLTLLGALLAARAQGAPLDFRLALVLAANLLAVTYAFMLNDIEDAANDAVDPERAARNVICSGGLSVVAAWWLTGLAGAASLGLYLLAGRSAAAIGLSILALGHLYSWRAVRLKAYPLVDVVSHSLMLGGLLVLVGSSLYAEDVFSAWYLAGAAAAVSAYGQLYNQLRDFEADQLAGLRNTAGMLGRRTTRGLMYAALGVAVLILAQSATQGHFPVGLGLAALAGMLISLRLGGTNDMRGGLPAEASGVLQTRGLFTLNFAAGVWFAWALIGPLAVRYPLPFAFGG